MRHVALLLSALILSGCNLSGATLDDEFAVDLTTPIEAPAEASPTPTRHPTQAISATATVIPSVTPVSIADARAGAEGCPIPPEHAPYRVNAGDTLFNIAQRYRTTVDALVEANCLPDRNALTVGQVLQAPLVYGESDNTTPLVEGNATSTAPNTATGNDTTVIVDVNPQTGRAGALSVDPAEAIAPGHYRVQSGQPVTIRWTGYGPSNEGIDFINYTYKNVGSSRPFHIGRDDDLTDGVSFEWTVLPGMNVEVTAYARPIGGTEGEFWSPPVQISTEPETGGSTQPGGQIGLLQISNSALVTPGHYAVADNATFMINWIGNAEYNDAIDYVTFSYFAAGKPWLMDTDYDASDGVSIDWTGFAGMDMEVTAYALMKNGNDPEIWSPPVRITGPTPVVTATPMAAPAASIKSFGHTGEAVLRGGAVTLTWESENMVSLGIRRLEQGTGRAIEFIANDLPANDSFAYVLPDEYTTSAQFAIVGRDANGFIHELYTTVPIICPFTPKYSPPSVRSAVCPINQFTTQVVSQPFEGGIMIWRRDTNRITVLYQGIQVEEYADTWSDQTIEITDTVPEGRYAPDRGFGFLWSSNASVRDRLGWATAPEQSNQSALIEIYWQPASPVMAQYIELSSTLTVVTGSTRLGGWAYVDQ